MKMSPTMHEYFRKIKLRELIQKICEFSIEMRATFEENWFNESCQKQIMRFDPDRHITNAVK